MAMKKSENFEHDKRNLVAKFSQQKTGAGVHDGRGKYASQKKQRRDIKKQIQRDLE